MPRELIIPATVMSLAFVFYTTGVFAERRARDLHEWHVVLFWLGIICDSTATEMMFRLMLAGGASIHDWPHILTGALALALMLGHAIWATWTLTRGSESMRRGFHRYSVIVWTVWLIPYLGGMIAGMMRGAGG